MLQFWDFHSPNSLGVDWRRGNRKTVRSREQREHSVTSQHLNCNPETFQTLSKESIDSAPLPPLPSVARRGDQNLSPVSNLDNENFLKTRTLLRIGIITIHLSSSVNIRCLYFIFFGGEHFSVN